MGHKSRYRDSRREAERSYNQNPAKPEVEEEEQEQEIELVEAQEAENKDGIQAAEPVEVTSEKPESEEDPLEALRRQFEEVSAERDQAKQRALNLEQRARQQEAQLQHHQVSELTHHKTVLEQAYSAEELKLADAKRKYAAALSLGDFEAAADAQLEMTRSDGVMRQYATAYQEIEQRERAPRQAPRPVQQADPFEQALSTMDPRVAAWARQHKDDVIARQDVALAADRVAQSKGLQPGSDEYLTYLNEVMGYTSSQAQRQQNRSMRMPAAPVSRSSSSNNTRRVYLNEDDKRQARQLNMSDAQYASFKVKAQEGQGGQQGPGMQGRLHARFTASGN